MLDGTAVLTEKTGIFSFVPFSPPIIIIGARNLASQEKCGFEYQVQNHSVPCFLHRNPIVLVVVRRVLDARAFR